MPTIIDTYDMLRPINLELIRSEAEQIRNASENPIILDLCCSTNSTAKSLASLLRNARFIGLDNEMEVLLKGKEISSRSRVILSDANMPAFKDEAFDIILINHAVHYLNQTTDTYKKIASMLKSLGKLIICQADVNDIDKYWEYIYFPKALLIDKMRLPSINKVHELCSTAKLKFKASQHISFERRIYNMEFINRVKKKHISSLKLIQEQEFNIGVSKMVLDLGKMKGKKQDINLILFTFEKQP